MTTHKLTAGDGYQYLIRRVDAVDSTARGRAPLIDFYSSKGESPGRWVGSGLASLKSSVPLGVPASDVALVCAVPEGSQVTEAQMKALFGEGLHANADAITAYATARGVRGVAASTPPNSAASSISATAKPPLRAPWQWPTATTTKKPECTGTCPSTRLHAPRSAPSPRAECSPSSTAAARRRS